MLKDIKQAKKSIFLETYIYDKDSVGEKFKKALMKKASQGVKVKVLVDAWGSTADKAFFQDLIDEGAEVRFYREFRYTIRIFSKNHERNHRKLLIIDNKVSYIGSANITASCLNWRELVIRLEGDITPHFSKSFKQSWQSFGKPVKRRFNSVIHKGFEIIQEVPSLKYKTTEKKYVQLIESAKKTILIEAPYFVPSHGIRKAFARAVKRHVKIVVVLPKISDVKIIDIVRNRYLGELHKEGIKIYYYSPKILHSKLFIMDNKFFILGSSNLDYRSFLHQYEINLLGKDRKIINELNKYFYSTLLDSTKFNINEWKRRSSLVKIPEMIISYLEKYL